MSGFLNWSVRYGRNKFYRFLLFFILFCIFSFFIKSCKVHASSWAYSDQKGKIYMYAQTQNCDLDQNNDFTCTKGTPMKFIYNINTTNNDAVDIPWLIPNDHNILISNLIYDVDLEDTYTISNSNRAIFLRLGNTPSFYENRLNNQSSSSSRVFMPSMFPLNTYVNDSLNKNYSIPSMNGFKPFYCSYYDTVDQQTKTCNIVYAFSNNETGFKVIPVIPNGTSFNRITIYFGTTNLYSGGSKELCNVRVPNSPTLISYGCGEYSYDVQYGQVFSDWRINTDPSVGIWFYPKGSSIETPKFILPNQSAFVSGTSDDFITNAAYGVNFSNLSSGDVESYQGLINSIEEDLEESYADSWFDDSLSGFTDSEASNSFLNLFNSLVSYPLSKFSQQNQEKLTYTNINGTENLSDHICLGSGVAGDFGNGLNFELYGKSFKFPCVHYDIYSKIYNDSWGFYPTTLNGASIVGGRSNNIYSIIKIVMDGVLIYFMFISCLDLYRYVLDSDRKEIEVLDL